MTLCDAALDVLTTADPLKKVSLTYSYVKDWEESRITKIGSATPPDQPARPDKPEVCAPRDMPRRRLGSEAGRIALIHAIAHIELNAIDLAWDIMVRFQYEDLPKEFYDDWVRVAYDEAVHFELLNDRLSDFGATYGDFPAHNGLWDAAYQSKDDIMMRCALVPMVLEPRGLDTTPPTVDRLRRMEDHKTADIMERIGFEEIAHVRAGTHWFNHMAERRGLDPVETYQKIIKENFKGGLKAPFNTEARNQAGLTPDYYEPLSNLEASA
ncbi:ferritin-like domain-containing protein [Terasakiella sp. A23]|uniref:ferritin-like domain-containing protein n=1 Tax=Terasakiella sp. FCG-A23 TaxID=3080561 RepID=UPI0029531548|nr:ferritin-like domain-containing protein [Terasakiella sp. A23]MDV7339418.1 ferritin-like domain-containing protein [Terasakiella sp. A23]